MRRRGIRRLGLIDVISRRLPPATNFRPSRPGQRVATITMGPASAKPPSEPLRALPEHFLHWRLEYRNVPVRPTCGWNLPLLALASGANAGSHRRPRERITGKRTARVIVRRCDQGARSASPEPPDVGRVPQLAVACLRTAIAALVLPR